MRNISDEKWDVVIIGGGAAGLAAAAEMGKRGGLKVLLLEKRARTGSKICASGNGRCNLSNSGCADVDETLKFFSGIGVITRTDEEGRIYPYSEEAADVERALRLTAEAGGVAFSVNTSVTGLEKTEDGFTVTAGVTTEGRKAIHFIAADRVLLATGGKAAPKLGTTGDGYIMAKKLGHRVLPLAPVLTAVEVKEDISELAGVREKARVFLYKDGDCIFSEDGEVQFTKDSLSGICIFNMSRFLTLGEGKSLKDGFDEYGIFLDFMPEYTEDEAAAFVKAQKERGFLDAQMLNSVVKEKLAKAIAGKTLSEEEPEKQLKKLKFTPKMPKGWEIAQVTRGGVDYDEINEKTMESGVVPGLYLAGEVLDYDGPCGGFNLNHSWMTGIKAARGICTEFSR